jgi:NADH:ubiquinone oxidoreductase subunit 5 (subunit L)/multisubunit Na+/H+ antiporter MnhA subunit
MATAIASYLFILYRMCMSDFANYSGVYAYPSRRHLIPLVIPVIFCVGIGVYATGSWIHEKFRFSKLKSGFRGRLRNVWVVQLMILMIIIISVLLPKTLKPQRFDKLGVKESGQWIREHSHKSSPVILSSSARNAYYADASHIQIFHINNVLSKARTKKIDYILITQKEYKAIEKELLQSVKDKKIALAHKFPEGNSLNKRSILLYKVLY